MFDRLTAFFVLCLVYTVGALPARAQLLINEHFESVSGLTSTGWVMINNSFPVGVGWTQGGPVFPFAAHSSPASSWIRGDNNATSGFNATISLWLLTPAVTLRNGQTLTFWTRTKSPVQFPDRLQVRMSLNGSSVVVGNSNTSVGDFTTLLLDINPTYSFAAYPTGYPTVWTQFTIVLSGIAAPTTGRLAFRYFVEETVDRAEVIGIDDVVLAEAAPDPCQQPLGSCPADIAGNNDLVNVADLLALIGNWGQVGPPRPPGDLAPPPVGDCLVNVADLLALIGAWGACPPASGACCLGDGSCLPNQTPAQCSAASGFYQGDDSSCATANCDVLNDMCAGATTVGNGTLAFNTIGAGTDGVPVAGSCIETRAHQAEADIWYRYVATCTGTLRVSTCPEFGGEALHDTAIVIYADTGVCPPPDASRIGCNDDSCGLQSTVTASVTSGSTYLIRVGGIPNQTTGHGTLSIACLP